MGYKNCIQNERGKCEGKRYLEDLGVDGKIILRWNLKTTSVIGFSSE
jgi:hypothetical protein